jgi:protein-S-isoprenylcysteine O-methyltransferase Ste14
MAAKSGSQKQQSDKGDSLQVHKDRLLVAGQRFGKFAAGLAEKHEVGERLRASALLQSWEVVFGTALGLGIVLQVISPLYFHAGWSTGSRILVGLFPLLPGLALSLLAAKAFAKANQSVRAGTRTTRLVRKGIYAHSRNPFYMGLLLTHLGLAIVFNMPWWLVLLFPLVPAVHFLLVIPEERRLAEYFGPMYAVYSDSVCRWVCPATFGMDSND